MDKNGSVIVLFVLLLVVFGRSDASDLRKLDSIPDPNGTQDSALSSPPPPNKTGDLSTGGTPKPKDEPVTNSLDSGDKKLDAGKTEEGRGVKTFSSERCKGKPVCNDQGKTIMACVEDFENGSNNLTLIVQNEQDVNLKVSITYGTSIVQTYELPAHTAEKVNITFTGAKSNKVILNAGNGDCELQISQPSSVNSPSKPKDPENTSNAKDVKNPVDSPAKPKDVNNTADTPTKPKDVQNATDTPAKPNDVNPANSPTKPKDMDTPAKSKKENDPPKSKVINTPPKSKDGDDQSKAKDADDHSKSKEADDPTKSKDVDDSTKPTPTSFNAPVSKNNVFDQFTFYSKQVTPMHGAYLAFLVALVIGGSWALCSIRKRRTGGGVPYQELEMGPSESANAVDVETAEGWEHDWDDDDWDEDKAIRSPGGSNRAITISSNGLTSRATKKDDWDANWDD
ncbi:hypothetical protein M8C21_017794 [Ambrosia artemisiifolia]|uniref:DUF7356 domain-containing protein n=1 Tax=Ambrosia artemisiifolia TaxID=4212 RepID=A0AAD5CNV5_AMBAR|nr:hypothetical protein M8C21_017794 [Ambrosia artemisiifolia]